MGTFLAFAFIFVTICYGLGCLWGDHKQRIKRRDDAMSKGWIEYDYNGHRYVGDTRVYQLNKNGRDVFVDANNSNNIIYDLTTREEGRLREDYLKAEQVAIDKAKLDGYDWFFVPNCERGSSESRMRKEISSGRLFKIREFKSPKSYWIVYYKLLNPIGTGRMEYVIDNSIPHEKITEEEYLRRFYHIDYKEREKRNAQSMKDFNKRVVKGGR